MQQAHQSLLQELKRRNVIRMAGLYLVGAWLLVQVAGTVLPMFGAPEWIARSVVVVLAIGFVPALAFAWAFEMTPDGLKRDAEVDPAALIAPQTARRMNRLIVAVLVLAVTFFGFDRLVLAPRRDAALVVATTQSVKAAAATAATPKVDPRSIAVLPFVNMSEDKDNEFFSDGISEELLNALVRVEGLGVASRTSSFAFKGKDVAASAIAGQLKVRYILEGSVRKQGDAVRITAQLIDASNDRHVWSETFDRKLTDIFKIQDEIANAIVTAVRGSVGPGDATKAVNIRADTGNLDAYQSYLKARELFIARSDLKESIRLFEHAVELDPNFARGWEGLSATYVIAESWLGGNQRDYVSLAEKAAHRALELDPALSMPWATLGGIEEHTLPVDWASSLAKYDRAVAADPKNATAFLWRSIAWDSLGFFDRALADQNLCLAIDPAYRHCTGFKALTLLFAGDEARAMELFEQGVAAGYLRSRADSFVPLLFKRGDRTGARLLLKELGASPELGEILLTAISRPGAPRPDINAIERRFLSDKDSPYLIRFGESKTMLWLGAFDRVATARDFGTDTMVVWDPVRPDFRNTPGFKKTLERLGVPAYWRKHGFPPHCRALGSNDFSCDKASP